MLTARSTTPGSAAPSGRDEVTEALLTATASLCARRLPSSVSIREVAAEAGVAPGLVYHYFDSKEGLLRATVDRLAADISALAVEEDDAAEMVRVVCRHVVANPAFSHILSSMALEGRSVTEEMSGHPFMQELIPRVAEQYPGPDVQDRVGVVLTILLSSGLIAPQINQALGRDADDAALIEHLSDAVGRIIEGAGTTSGPPDGSPGT